MSLLVRTYNRDFTEPFVTPAVSYQVERYSWSVFGGPRDATIHVAGSQLALWEMLELLRCPVEIYDNTGEPRWWGYANEIELQMGAIRIGVSIESMANHVSVAYAHRPEGSVAQNRQTTTWAENADSVAEFGYFSRLESSSSESAATAEAWRDQLLDLYKYPVPTVTSQPGSSGISATLHCAGWWQMLHRRYYQYIEADPDDIENIDVETIIERMITDCGQYITALVIEDATGVTLSEQYEGDTSCGEELEAILAHGTSNFRRLLAEINRNRVLRVWEEDAPAVADYLICRDGTIRDAYDNRLPPGACPVGVWVQAKDIFPATVNVSKLAKPSPMFIEESEWDEKNHTLIPSFRGWGNPLRMIGIEAG